MKKKLDTSGVMNELRGNSVFFPKKPQAAIQEQVQTPPTPLAQIAQQPRAAESVKEPIRKGEEKTRDTVIPRYHDTKHDTTTPINHDTMLSKKREDIFEIVSRGSERARMKSPELPLTTLSRTIARMENRAFSQNSSNTSTHDTVIPRHHGTMKPC